jgi:hypothetical protein
MRIENLPMALRFARYGKRFWAVYENESLLCVTAYKKGAQAVVQRLGRQDKTNKDS